jgi:hypothetical protein
MASDSRGYDPPSVEDLPAQDGPAVTAAGDSPPNYPSITLIEPEDKRARVRRGGRVKRLRRAIARRRSRP